ncbi:unnamed protein product [Pipistrellus nathusii]|uniref:Uncharacterized protein n=1 Tax=Pipistrellus nathusii TaxID=59473 RepID=A0ABP0A659_PIPNA
MGLQDPGFSIFKANFYYSFCSMYAATCLCEYSLSTKLASCPCLLLVPGARPVFLLPWICWKWEGIGSGPGGGYLLARARSSQGDLGAASPNTPALVAFGLTLWISQLPKWDEA